VDRDILALNCALLEEGSRLLETIEPAAYSRPVAEADSDGVGAHVRHCIDFYDCFLRGLDRGNVDYDDRRREAGLELDASVARQRMGELVAQLAALPERALPHTLAVRQDAGAEDGRRPAALSSVDRELQFLAAHTVHHYALVRVLLKLQGVDVPDAFGIAPSTLRFWQARAR
jgi:hypothetical protein